MVWCRGNIVSEILPGGERIVAGQDVEILAGEAGSRYGRHGPVLPRFICVSIDLVRDMGFILEKIALNEEDTVGSKTMVPAQVNNYGVCIGQERHRAQCRFFDPVSRVERVQLHEANVSVKLLHFAKSIVIAGTAQAELCDIFC